MSTSQRTAMERAWSSYDVIVLILETMDPGPHLKPPLIYPYDSDVWADRRRRNRAALACTARVCRALSSVALDILWRYIGNAFDIIHLVPSCYKFEAYKCLLPSDRDDKLVSACTVTCESMLHILTDDYARTPCRYSLGPPTNRSYILCVPTRPG